MKTPGTTRSSETSLTEDLVHALRYWLRGRRWLIALTVPAVLAGAAFNWSWLVAAGIAPILLALAPCVAMCALGLCMSKKGAKSCSTRQGSSGDTGSLRTLPSRTTPFVARAGQTNLDRGGSETPAHPAAASSETAAIDQPRTSKERKDHA